MKLNPTLKAKIQNPLMTSLCCVALNQGLRSVLLFDSSPLSLQQVAGILASLLAITTGCEKVVPVKLGTFESEDDLWGQIGLEGELEKQAFKWQSGLLGEAENTNEIRLVIIPDLTKLSLAAMRASVVLMGANVAHLERHGQKKSWQPNLCWLAGCSSQEEEIGKISPHLLDRFALRLNGKIKNNTDRVSQIQQLLNGEILEQELLFHRREIEPELQQWLRQVHSSQPEMTPEALERILDYTSESKVYHRREITLARFSSTYAQLEEVNQVTVNHVDRVAKIIGLKLEQNLKKNGIDAPINYNSGQSNTQNETLLLSNLPPRRDKDLLGEKRQIPVYQPGSLSSFSDIFLSEIVPLGQAYIEDNAPMEREIASLKLPPRRFQSKTIARGTIIGVEKTSTVQDLAIVRTLLEAAKFKKIRQNNALYREHYLLSKLTKLLGFQGIIESVLYKNGMLPLNIHQKLKILPTDLYRYRRAPVAEQMLMLLLDYTCLEYCQWQEQLFPYISWAYTQRASVGLIQVGIASDSIIFNGEESIIKINPEELRAKKISAQNILVPSISIGLDLEKTKKGQATPLAHGLDLTLQTLRHALQHGKNTIHKAILVVISDGRGNVPLEASHLGKIQPPVGRKGVEDALEIARKISNLDKVETFLLNPQSKQYPELPLLLAKALGAKVVPIPPVKTWEVEEWE
jgi:magnesium chelatase subunit D